MKNNFKSYYEKHWNFDGQSALCIYGVYTENFQGDKHPYDPDDLTRCFQCLRMITSGQKISEWKEHIQAVVQHYPESKEWKAILENFDELFITYFQEYNTDRMIKTYNLMKRLGL